MQLQARTDRTMEGVVLDGRLVDPINTDILSVALCTLQ
jgi:hypothetical protein